MSQVTTVPRSQRQGVPGKGFSIGLFTLAGALLLALLAAVLADGPAFNDFPDRTIGISLLSDIDPHYRTYLFLLLSALVILASGAFFVLTRWRPVCTRPAPVSGTTALLLSCALGNALMGLFHPDRSLFFTAAGHCVLLLALWLWHCRGDAGGGPQRFLLRLGLAWQGATLCAWLGGLATGAIYLGLFLALFLSAGPFLRRLPGAGGPAQRPGAAAATWLLWAPVLLVAAIEWAYLRNGTEVLVGQTLQLFGLLSLGAVAAGWVLQPGPRCMAMFAALGVLLSTFIVNQYDGEILYRGYDIFHLAEPMLPLQQWDSYRSLPFLDYHPGHGLFDVLPQAFYHVLNRGDPLESLIWGNGYFHGWVMQSLYIGLLYLCLSRFAGAVTSFFLLWLLPVFQLLDPYNTLLLLPVLHIGLLPRSRRPWLWWLLQWLLTLALMLWRPDFGLIVTAGNIMVMGALSWHRRQLAPLFAGAVSLVVVSLPPALLLQLLPERYEPVGLLQYFVDILDIQVLAASFDRFYKSWNYLAWIQYIVMPLTGAIAGGYGLARVYLRADPGKLATHLALIFVTAIGFALSIRLFQRHSLVEGFTNTNFFYFAALLALLALPLRTGWRGPVAALFLAATFLATPKMHKYSENSPWSPRRSYPISTHDTGFPPLARSEPRLVNRVDKYDGFIDFTRQYLGRGQTFYDFANAPLLYMLADVKLPVFVYETVWHTSEKVQDRALAELEALRRKKLLPLVVFRQNKPLWDALDGVDNALRSYRVAEYIYEHYRPCVKISRMDLWADRRTDCRGTFKSRIAAGSPARRGARFLEEDYLEQFIDFGHLPYIWANYDSMEDPVLRAAELEIRSAGNGVIELTGDDGDSCRRGGCYLDLEIDAADTRSVPVYFNDHRQLAFTVRPGRHRYRVRISALWRWYRALDADTITLRPENPVIVRDAALVQLEPGGRGSPETASLQPLFERTGP